MCKDHVSLNFCRERLRNLGGEMIVRRVHGWVEARALLSWRESCFQMAAPGSFLRTAAQRNLSNSFAVRPWLTRLGRSGLAVTLGAVAFCGSSPALGVQLKLRRSNDHTDLYQRSPPRLSGDRDDSMRQIRHCVRVCVCERGDIPRTYFYRRT